MCRVQARRAALREVAVLAPGLVELTFGPYVTPPVVDQRSGGVADRESKPCAIGPPLQSDLVLMLRLLRQPVTPRDPTSASRVPHQVAAACAQLRRRW